MTSQADEARTWLPAVESDANPSNATNATNATNASNATPTKTSYEDVMSTVINNTEDKYILFKYAERGFMKDNMKDKAWAVDDFEYRFEVNYSVYVLGGDPGSFATGHDATRSLTTEGARCMLFSRDFMGDGDEIKYKKVLAEIIKTSTMGGGIVPYKKASKVRKLDGDNEVDKDGDKEADKEADKKAIQGIYGIKINSAHFIGKTLKPEENGAHSFRFLIHDPKNGKTNKQLFNMSVVKAKVVGENFIKESDQWLRMNDGLGKNQMCVMNVGPDDMDYVYSWVIEKTHKAEEVKDLLFEGVDNFNSKISFFLNVDSNEEKLFKDGEAAYFEKQEPVTKGVTRGLGGATRGLGGATRGGDSVKKVHQYNTVMEAAPSIGVAVRKVQIEPPTFFLRFKGIFTEDELKEKEEERFKGVVEDMVEDMEME